MNIVAIEDELTLRNALEHAISAAEPGAFLLSFPSAEDALAWSGIDAAQVAFVDIRLPGMDGVDAARALMARNPRMNIIFVTGYGDHLREAFELHASGYIMKPVSAAKVREELERLRYPVDTGPRIRIQCFGNFEVYVDDRPLSCGSRRSLELLAYLVDRRGTRCSIKEINAALLGEGQHVARDRHTYLRNLAIGLTRTLEEAGCFGVIVRQYGTIGLDVRQVSCDYWDYLEGKPEALRAFHGEYMRQYSWAESTLVNLIDFS